METLLSYDKVRIFLAVFLAAVFLVVLAIMIDLWDGIYTARKTGQRVHSHKMRVTIDKISEYFRIVAVGFLIDCIGYLFPIYFLPFFAMIFAIGLICIEISSLFEHAKRRKSHTADMPDVISRIINCSHEHDARKIIETISQLRDHGNAAQ